MQKLRHPNIVYQQDMIESADGMLYIVMEYVPGISTCCMHALRKRCRRTDNAVERGGVEV